MQIVINSTSVALPSPSPQAGDTVVFQDDFESGNLSKWDEAPGRYSVDSTEASSGQYSVRGVISPTLSSGELNKWFMPGYDEIYVRFDMRYDDAFLNGPGGAGLHLTSIMANQSTNKWSASGKAGIRPSGTDFFLSDPLPETANQTQNQSSLPMELYSQWPEMWCPSNYDPTANPNCYGNPITQNAPKVDTNDGQWHTYVVRIKANTVGQHDGLQEMWIDGKKVVQQSNLRWRDTTDLKINQLGIQLYMMSVPKTESVWFDNVTIWSPQGSQTTTATQSAVTQTTTTALAVSPVSIVTGSLPAATYGMSYSATLAASGGSAPYTWSMPSGSLPSGVALSATTGEVSGIAMAAGTYSFTAQVTDAAGQTSSRSLGITVQANPPSVVTSGVPGATVNVAYSTSLAATGGTAPYTWMLTGGSLPSGFSLNSAGQVTGSTSSTGNYNFTILVQDALGQTGSRAMSLSVTSPAPQVQGIFTEDFEDGVWSGYYTADPGHQTVVDSSSVPGGCLAGNKCGQIQTVAGGTGGQLWRAVYSSSVNQAIYMQFYVKFQAGFLWGTDTCGTSCAGGSNNMKLVYFQTNGIGNSKLYFEASGSGTQTPGGSTPNALWEAITDQGQTWMNGGYLTGDGQWHKVKIKMDKPNQQITYWIDNVQKGLWSDPVCGGGCTAWNELGIGLYNNNVWPQAQKAWFDNIVVSTSDPQ
jgi:hypothetical protein